MANKAFKLDAQLRKSGMIEAHCTDELRRRGFHECTIEEIRHHHERAVSYGRISHREIIGRIWRDAHGFGRPFHSGGGGKGARYKERLDAERRLAERRRRKKVVGRAAKVANAVRRIFRREGRKT